MKRFRLIALWFSTLGLLVACAPADNGRELVAPVEQSVPTRSINEITHALAVSLAEPQSRRALIAVMRKSPYTRHRVDVQTLVDAPEAGQLARGMANTIGVEPSELKSFIRSVGEFDVVVPVREHREQWNGGGEIAVSGYDVATTDPRLVAFRDDGSSFVIEYGRVVRGVTQILVEPSTPKYIRVDIKNRPGSVIQDPDDGGMGGFMRLTLPNGGEFSMQLAEWRGRRTQASDPRMMGLLQECNPEETGCHGGTGGGSSAPADTTFLDKFQVYFGDCGDGRPDPTITAKYYRDGVFVLSANHSFQDVDTTLVDSPGIPLIFARVRTGQSDDWINVSITERDPFICGGDDPKGSRKWFYGDNDVWREIFYDGVKTARVELFWHEKLF